MGRTPFSEKTGGLRKGPWTTEEDQKLIDYIHKNGYGNWRTLPKNAGLQRCGKSCRLRWTNYLRPDIKRGKFSFDEEETIIQLHSVLGNKWSTIAARLPGRTDNEIKNYWNTHIRKRLLRMGIDPVTHNPRLDLLHLSSILSSSSLYNPSQMSLLDVQSMVNPELLRLAASLLSSQCNQNPNLENTQQAQENRHKDQNQTLIQHVSSCAPMSEPSYLVPFSSETFDHLEQINYVHQFPSSVTSFRPHTCPLEDALDCNNRENYATLDENLGYHMDPQLDVDNKFDLASNFLNASTSSSNSSPMKSNSNATYINESTIEKDREPRYCSNLFKSEYQDSEC